MSGTDVLGTIGAIALGGFVGGGFGILAATLIGICLSGRRQGGAR